MERIIDRIIFYRIMSILLEMGLSSPVSTVDDYDERYSIRNDGAWRLHTFHLELRDDLGVEEFTSTFRTRLEEQNQGSEIKPVIVESSEYTAPFLNFHTVYLIVAVS